MDIFKRSRRCKSGSLQLSINAIVILVMAMVVLGLGLGFIRGLFGQGQDSLTKVMDNNMLENKASYNDPFTLDRRVEVKIGEAQPIFMGIYNPGDTADTYGITVTECKDQEDVDVTSKLNVVFPSDVSVPSRGAVGVRGSVLVPEGQLSGSYICTVKAEPGGAGNPVYTSTIFITASGG